MLQRVELPLHLGAVVLGAGGRHAVLGEERGDQRVGISHHRHGDALVDHPVEPEHDGHALAGAHGRENGSEVAGEELAEELQLLHHFAGREPASRGDSAVVLADPEPDGVDFTSERADHLGDDVEQEAELPLHRGARYRGGGGDAVAQPVGPLDDHRVPHLDDDTAGGEQRGLRSAHYQFPLIRCRQSKAERLWGQKRDSTTQTRARQPRRAGRTRGTVAGTR